MKVSPLLLFLVSLCRRRRRLPPCFLRLSPHVCNLGRASDTEAAAVPDHALPASFHLDLQLCQRRLDSERFELRSLSH